MPHHLTKILAAALLLPLAATAQYRVEHLPAPYNTPGSEVSAVRLGDSVMVYTSMPAAVGGSGAFGIKHPMTHVYQARLRPGGRMARPKHDRWGFCNDKDHTGNLAFDPATRDAYFTRADVETLHSEIWVARAKRRRGWEKPQKLRGSVNSSQYTATHPAVGLLADGTTVLYFASDRPGGMGGMDIWQCTVKDGVASEPVNLGPQVNSSHDEYTPFYDQPNGTLYFSSDRPGGKGGFDVYCAVGQRNTWQAAEPVCGCLNSEANDLYFNVSSHDSATGMPTGGYLASNRRDSFFLSDSMCCNDIYRWCVDTAYLLAMQEEQARRAAADSARRQPRQPEIDRFFPLFLYFHNDDPDPRSHDTTTTADYADCQLRYALMRSEYMAHQPSAADSASMERFFDSCVVGNFDRLTTLLDYVAEQLAAGRGVRLTITGHASPVYTDEYNQALSQRRIVAFMNLLRSWHSCALGKALDDGRLQVVQRPQGADYADARNDRHIEGHPVYGLAAARARRIVIISCEKF
ncbi:MAG: PD40 domain-containing protein [Bacteroidales bacterium]|nr:PD40 domain-containing protein [Bacteroidales bacterium]